MVRLIQNQEPFKLGTYLTFVQFDNSLYELEVTLGIFKHVADYLNELYFTKACCSKRKDFKKAPNVMIIEYFV